MNCVWRWSNLEGEADFVTNFYSARSTWVYTQLRLNKFKRRIGWKHGTSRIGLIDLDVYFDRIELCHVSNRFLDFTGFMCRLHFASCRSRKNKSSIYSTCRERASCPVIRVQDRHGQCGERHLKSQPLGGNGRESKTCLSKEHSRKIREEMLANVVL